MEGAGDEWRGVYNATQYHQELAPEMRWHKGYSVAGISALILARQYIYIGSGRKLVIT